MDGSKLAASDSKLAARPADSSAGPAAVILQATVPPAPVAVAAGPTAKTLSAAVPPPVAFDAGPVVPVCKAASLRVEETPTAGAAEPARLGALSQVVTCPAQLESAGLADGDQVRLLAYTSVLNQVYVIREQVPYRQYCPDIPGYDSIVFQDWLNFFYLNCICEFIFC